MSTRKVKLQIHRHTAAEWAGGYATEVLLDGQVGWSTDTHVLKIGDGVNVWSALATANAGATAHGSLTGLAYVDAGHTGFSPSHTSHATPWPVLTTTQMNALTPAEGMVCWNTTEHQLMVYDGTAWVGVTMTL